MATVPERLKHCRVVVEAILPQVDRLNVALNGHGEVPGFLRHEKVNAALMDNSLGDAAKFSWCDGEGYYLILDDDLIYPATYAEDMIQHVERYGRKAVVTLGGKRYDRIPIGSYYRDMTRNVRVFESLGQDLRVHVPLTPTVAFHSDVLRFTTEDLQQTGNGDVDLGLLLNERGIPCYAVAHEPDYLRHQDLQGLPTMYRRFKNNDRRFTEAVNAVQWQ